MNNGQHIRALTGKECSYPIRTGNSVDFWIDGMDFYTRIEECIERAQESIWVIVSFISEEFRMPSGLSFFDCMDQAAQRGVDVKVLFWRNLEFFSPANIFHGTESDLNWLKSRKTQIHARWDDSNFSFQASQQNGYVSQPGHSHHQKAWHFDAGLESECAFIGGMVFGTATLDDSRHQRRPRSVHDVFVELRGPACKDARSNFAQRWNHVSEQKLGLKNTFPDQTDSIDMKTPDAGLSELPVKAGELVVQLSRTVSPARYRGKSESGYDVFDGEKSIYFHYLEAIKSAQKTIYMESQHPGEYGLLCVLEQALKRGVQVVLVVPGEPMGAISQCRKQCEEYKQQLQTGIELAEPRYLRTFEVLGRLGDYQNFTLCSLALPEPENGVYREIYVHSKLAVVDGCWGTVGSANFVDLSMAKEHTELNCSFWGAEALELQTRLVSEHLEEQVGGSSCEDQLRLLAERASENRGRRVNNGALRGRVYQQRPEQYAS